MKKVVKILLPIFVASSTLLGSCKKNKNTTDDRFMITFRTEHATQTKEVNIEFIKNAVSAKENFMLVINTTTCSCWETFRPNVDKFIKNNKALVYRVTYDEIKDFATTYGLYNLSESTTTFAFFKDGVVKETINTNDNDNIMYSEEKFAQYVNEKVTFSNCYMIEKEDLTTIKNSGKNAVIYFERNACGDCSRLNPGLLRSYVSNHLNSGKIYVLDCQQYWARSAQPDTPGYDAYIAYLDFKDEVGLSAKYNPTFGYSSGVFPYFLYVENGQYASGCVIYNEMIQKNEDDQKYYITDSYYTEAMAESLQYTNTVLMNKEIPTSDLNISEWTSLTKEAADNLYRPIFNAFLDYTLPKTNFNF